MTHPTGLAGMILNQFLPHGKTLCGVANAAVHLLSGMGPAALRKTVAESDLASLEPPRYTLAPHFHLRRWGPRP